MSAQLIHYFFKALRVLEWVIKVYIIVLTLASMSFLPAGITKKKHSIRCPHYYENLNK
jgi:hypothetical protein